MEIKLTTDQQRVFDEIEYTFSNVLLCGKPGTGKSVITRFLQTNGSKTYHFSASTGLAAININARTLHSLLRLPVGLLPPDYNNFTTDDRTIANIKYNIKYLVIDEISMVRADLLDFVDRQLKYIKGNDLPFGGIQVIMVGDFFQLPPVVVGVENQQMKEYGWTSPFAFHSKAFINGNFKVFFLEEVLRQKGDNKFIELLDRARIGQPTPKDIALINKCVGKGDEFSINLCATNAQADQINGSHLRAIPGEPTVFNATIFGNWPKQAYPTEEKLQLKIGAVVMVKQNGADRPPGLKGEFASAVVNGTIGKVVEINGSNSKSAGNIFARKLEEMEAAANGESPKANVVIELPNGEFATIYSKRWEQKVREPMGNGQYEERVVASFEQMPLSLAWAISMHKSQGQTFDKAHIDASKVFAAGQLYVALSRVRSLAGLTLEAPLDAKKFMVNAHVVRFFNNLKETV